MVVETGKGEKCGRRGDLDSGKKVELWPEWSAGSEMRMWHF